MGFSLIFLKKGCLRGAAPLFLLTPPLLLKALSGEGDTEGEVDIIIHCIFTPPLRLLSVPTFILSARRELSRTPVKRQPTSLIICLSLRIILPFLTECHSEVVLPSGRSTVRIRFPCFVLLTFCYTGSTLFPLNLSRQNPVSYLTTIVYTQYNCKI
jgi:hypothetical protein